MKKIIYSLCLTSIFLACSGDQAASTQDLIASKNLKGLKTQKEKKLKSLNALKLELNQINTAISDLDPSEKLALISMFEVKPENFEHYIDIQANIKTRQNVLLYPEYNGTLKRVYVAEGQKVKKGKLLAQIDDAGLKNQLEQLEIQAKLSKTTYERTQRLWDQNIGSEMQLLQTKANYESQLKSIAQLKKQLQRTQILAPFSGTIDEIVANTGANLLPGQTPVMRIVNLQQMYTEASVPERYLREVKKGTSAKVSIPMLDREYSTTIRQTGNFINPNNRSFRVETPLPNPDEMIKPNLSCKLKINDYSNPQALMIPLRIVKENALGKKYIFKLKPDGKDQVYRTQQIFVQLGKKSSDKIEVLEGLQAGDLLVDEGATIVENNQRVKNIQ
ncbi:MAG: efflux RND transporter periplasmic adaptor subunit [Bacteroidetes bacterium]|jgi:RND family efflux transporter MFP subunit|nr:efflux RND transporter periplasmic adaptor subunit [Flavobacteriaceae bacterium]MBT6128269.1 efflux RND transporter periplasmic adaptor subunit [Flavobacteriaceae bacterium]MDG1940989.1 efflux RND transporter periplasmic adaptor subunit [Flavobacteriaceae bacterium]NCF31426.1 efflux RND transporter periplasmic adaptor subunit [Bacteroidota bacterium]|tara:strand:+ start:36 stop:1202 length:1167 start_codon:yes stop_codon:yes gene_type:complete